MRSALVWVVAAVIVVAVGIWRLRAYQPPASTLPPSHAVPDARPVAGVDSGPYVRPLPTTRIDPVVDDAGVLTCPGGGCTIECGADDKCTAACPGGLCRQECRAGADCAFTCDGGSCLQRCAAGARCQMACGGGRCLQDCAGAKECTRTCVGKNCQ